MSRRIFPPETIKNYHTMFRHIHPKTLEAIKRAKERGVWHSSREEGFNILRLMFAEISEVYNIPTPTLIVDRYEYYNIPSETIGLPRVSLVSALHEFRHHMQKYGKQHYNDIEVDARAWSISAFRLALPNDFERAWRNGRIWYLPPYPYHGATSSGTTTS